MTAYSRVAHPSNVTRHAHILKPKKSFDITVMEHTHMHIEPKDNYIT